MKTLYLAAAAALALAVSPATAQPAPAGTSNLVTTAKADAQFTTLAKAIEAAGLTQDLAAAGPFTLFAPTDAAFAKLPSGTLDTLMQPANREQLRALLMNHVVEGQAKADYFAGKTGDLTALGGGKLSLDGASGVKINGATVVKADIAASNGVIHAIDTVLVPGEATAAAPAAASAGN